MRARRRSPTPSDPLSAAAVTDALTTNGDTETTAYDKATRTLAPPTAGGRQSTTRFDSDGPSTGSRCPASTRSS